MATCVIIGSAETRIIERGEKPALVYTPRFSAGSSSMIDQSHTLLDGRSRTACPAASGRRMQEHLDAEFARGGDLAVGRRAAAVLGDDGVDAVCLEKLRGRRLRETAARENVGRIRHAERRLDRIDAADQIGVLRRGLEGRDFLTAERQETLCAGLSPSAATASAASVDDASSGRPRPAPRPDAAARRRGTPASRAASAALAEICAA